MGRSAEGLRIKAMHQAIASTFYTGLTTQSSQCVPEAEGANGNLPNCRLRLPNPAPSTGQTRALGSNDLRWPLNNISLLNLGRKIHGVAVFAWRIALDLRMASGV